MHQLKKPEQQPTGVALVFFYLIKSIYIIFVVSRACVYKAYRAFVPAIKEKQAAPPPNYDKIYKKYLDIYADPSKNPDANLNIDINLYDYEKRNGFFSEENNACEKQWKSKLLYEFTPRGNIIVYYNPYKHAFMYYCDENSIPYNIMQYIAKKYVVMFRCRDFFIDPEMYPDNRILDVLKKEEEALNTKSKKVKDITKCVDKEMNMNNKNIFAALKSYKEDEVKEKAKAPVKNKFSNTFIRLGKICEFNIIQKLPNKNIEIINSILFGENNIGKSMDFFDDLDIAENPFSMDKSNTNDKSEVQNEVRVKAEDDAQNEARDEVRDEVKAINEMQNEDVDNAALSKAKSWKEFKNLKKI
jgi:hypothetical protein